MKKTLCLLLILVIGFQLFPVFADGDYDEGDGSTYDDYPIIQGDMFYCGRFVLKGDESASLNISTFILTVSGVEHNVSVNTDGTFEFSSLSEDNAIITLDSDEYILSTSVSENNIVFPSTVSGDNRYIYVEKLLVITGRVMNDSAEIPIEQAQVQCFKRDDNGNWVLWTPVPLLSDEDGEFICKVDSGEYIIRVKKDGYEDYDSFSDPAYAISNRSLINTKNEEYLSPILKLKSISTLSIVGSTPNDREHVLPNSGILVNFDKELNKEAILNASNCITLHNNTLNVPMPCTINVQDENIAIIPDLPLKGGNEYKVTLTQKILALDNSKLQEQKIITFFVDETQTVEISDIYGHWAENDIKFLIESEIVSGYEDDGVLYFKPENNINRQELSKFIVLANQLPLDTADVTAFSDVAQLEDWAIPYAAAAYKNGLIMGDEQEDGTILFNPKKNVTRAEIITIIGRVFDAEDQEFVFADSNDVPDWAQPYISACVINDIVKGYEEDGDVFIKPNNNVTRAEAAAMIARMMNEKY